MGNGPDHRDVAQFGRPNGHFRNAAATTRSLLPAVYW
jgi:hypothetical protein